jgi:FtsH-binding integral membrane protein
MIRKTTILKRMVLKTWKPLAFGILSAGSISLLATAAEYYLNTDYNTTYWSLYGVLIAGFFVKSAYDWTRMQIEFEQEKMLRDLGKNND